MWGSNEVQNTVSFWCISLFWIIYVFLPLLTLFTNHCCNFYSQILFMSYDEIWEREVSLHLFIVRVSVSVVVVLAWFVAYKNNHYRNPWFTWLNISICVTDVIHTLNHMNGVYWFYSSWTVRMNPATDINIRLQQITIVRPYSRLNSFSGAMLPKVNWLYMNWLYILPCLCLFVDLLHDFPIYPQIFEENNELCCDLQTLLF